jgi:hypothetical protein
MQFLPSFAVQGAFDGLLIPLQFLSPTKRSSGSACCSAIFVPHI